MMAPMSADAAWSAAFGGLASSGGRVYDEIMVPRLFEPWARLLLEQLGVSEGEAALDVACGPGSVTRMLAARVGAAGRVVGCDLSPTMLAAARAKPPVEHGAGIEYLEGHADDLPVGDAQFDVVTCQQGLQFFPDRPRAVAEMHRALRPGGRVGIAVWAQIDRCPPFHALAEALGEVVGPELETRYGGGPWGFPEPEPLRELLERAGFEGIRVTTRELPLVFEGGVSQLAATLGATPLAAEADAFGVEQVRRIHEAVARRMGSGAIESSTRSNIALARR